MRQLNYYHRSNDFKTTIFVTLALGAIYEGYKLLDHVGKKIIDKKMVDTEVQLITVFRLQLVSILNN